MPDLSKDTLLFAKERRRMCQHTQCTDCGLFTNFCVLGRGGSTKENDIHILEVVQKWSDEHPQKTYAMDFFEKFPDAPRKDLNVEHLGVTPEACKRSVYGGKCKHVCSICWNSPMEEENNETD